MKSLEIVNERIEHLEDKLKSAYELANGKPSSFGKQLIDCYEKYLDGCKQIKQDLEVLEILRKLFGDMEIDIWYSKRFHKTIGEIRFSGTDFVIDVEDFGVTLENLLKLKQWLERGNVR